MTGDANDFKNELAKIQAQELFGKLAARPLMERYITHLKSGGERAANTEPWHGLGERLYAAAQCLHAVFNEEIRVDTVIPEHRTEVLMIAAKRIFSAPVFLWSLHAEELADGAPLPRHNISPTVMPAPAMFWSREGSNTASFEGREVDLNWLALWHQPNKMVLVGDMVMTEPGNPNAKPVYALQFHEIYYGTCWPEPGKPVVEMDGMGRVLRRCAFLNSPYVDKQKTRLKRHERRQLQRAGEPPEAVEETVNVVQLRREIKERVKAADNAAYSAEWKHQWWVSGHYRAQWYPHEEAHRVIWIAPYLKGPSDMPLLEKVYAVVR